MILYKYLSPERIDILLNKKIRFTQASCFYDPFELYPYYEVFLGDEMFQKFENIVKQKVNDENLDMDFFNFALKKLENIFTNPSYELNISISKIFRDVLDKKYGILSLSSKSNNVLMWSHYADKHKGFLIGFNENLWHNEVVDFINKTNKDFYKVEYTKIRPQFKNVDSIFKEELLDDFFFKILATKSSQWKYENEYRLIANIENIQPVIENQENIYLLPFSL